MRASWLLSLVMLVGCVDTATIQCASGVVCPSGTLCDEAHPGGCITQEQLDACPLGAPNGTLCTLVFADDGVCDGGVCLSARCGDGLLSPGEQCDMTAFASTAVDNCLDVGFYDDKPLGCTSSCMPDPTACTGTCGDRLVDSRYELCDGEAPTESGCTDFGFGAGVLGCSVNCGPGFATCIPFGWEETTLPATLSYLSGLSSTNVWVVGAGGLVRHFDGTTWLPIDVSACTTEDLRGVVALSTTEAVVYTNYSTNTIVFISATGCTKTTSPVEIFGFWASSLTDAYVGGESSLHHFQNGSWTQVDALDSPTVWGSGPNNVYVGDYSGNLRRWNGLTWSTPAPVPGVGLILSIWGSANDVYVGGMDATAHASLVHDTGSGFTSVLSQEPSLAGGNESYISSGSSANGVTVAFGEISIGNVGISRLLRNANGTGWVDLEPPISLSITPFVASDGTIFAVGRYTQSVLKFHGSALLSTAAAPFGVYELVAKSGTEAYLHTANDTIHAWDGAAWTQELSGSKDVAIDTAGNVLASTYSAGVRRRTGPNTWAQVTTINGFCVAGTSLTDIWVCTAGTQLTHWTGTIQSPVTLPMNIRDVAMVTPTFGIAVGTSGKIAHWNGSSWAAVPSPSTNILTGIFVISATDVYVHGGDSNLLHYDGANWSFLPNPPPVQSVADVWGTGLNDLFVAGNNGLHHFDGTQWTQVTADAGFSLTALGGTGENLFISTPNEVKHLLRTRPW